MSPYHKKQKEKRRKNLFRKWHRRVGFTAALFLVNLAVTGILLNHSESLKLHQQYVKTDWLVDWYGIKAPNKATCFNTSDVESLCQIGEKRILGSRLLELEANDLIGVVEFEELLYVASQEQISIYTKQWELVETVKRPQTLTSPIRSIGINNSLAQIIIASGQKYYIFNPDELTWTTSQIDPANYSAARPTADFSIAKLQSIYLDHQLNYLKLVQDLHSGRIIDSFGKWVTDIVAIIIILLAISGFLAWQKRTKN